MKRKIIALITIVLLFILFIPVVIAGFLFDQIKFHFEIGINISEDMNDQIDDSLNQKQSK